MYISALENNTPRIQAPYPPIHYALDSDPEVLTEIYNPDVNLCILKRSIEPSIKTYSHYLEQTRSSLRIAQLTSIDKLLDDLVASLPEHPFRNHFIEDVQEIAEMFCCLFELKRIGFRLCVLDKTMCPRFHTDKVPCRLITTYTGPGTEWLDWQVSDLSSLNSCDAHIPTSSSIHALDEGDIALFKGDQWDKGKQPGVIHRSPAVQAGKNRLLLTIDFAL